MSVLPRKDPPFQRDVDSIEMLAKAKERVGGKGRYLCQSYMWTLSEIEKLEQTIGGWTETIDYSGDDRVVLPTYIYEAAKANDIQKVLNWLGPPPVDKEKLNARNPELLVLHWCTV